VDAGSGEPPCEPGPCTCGDAGIGRGSCDAGGEPVCDCSALVACVPGEVTACECEEGGAGTARCLPAGDRIEACVCQEHFAAEGYAVPPEIACILQRKCSTCHGEIPAQGAPMPLVSWEDFHAPTPSQSEVPVYRWVGDRAGRDDALRMPPPGSRALSGVEQAALVAWVEDGAPPSDQPAPPEGGPSPDAIPAAVLQVLQSNCFICHGQVPIGGAIKLTAIDDWLQMSPLYEPSLRVWEVARIRVESGEMPQGGVLDESSKNILATWFAGGMPGCMPVQ
jgi:mono/diheme cytochrome c family protein